MSFVSLGDSSSRPTFFEMVAADRLMSSLKAAVVYSISVGRKLLRQLKCETSVLPAHALRLSYPATLAPSPGRSPTTAPSLQTSRQ
jgi:hypothetical protein